MTTKLLTQKQVEAEYGIPGRTQEADRYRGTGPKFVKLGRRVYYRRADIEAWLASNLRCSTSDSEPERGHA